MNTSEPAQTISPVKRPYAKPEIVYTQPLEAMAAACSGGGGKADTALGCNPLGLFS
jgi:hypothetical protein